MRGPKTLGSPMSIRALNAEAGCTGCQGFTKYENPAPMA
jgi:hypothetical protein